MAQFTEADLETAKKEAAEEARKKVLAEFTERDRIRATEARKQEIKGFCEASLKTGKLAPAWIDAGLPAFMESLGADEISFTEGKKDTAYAWFKGFLEELPKVVEFSEIATRDKDVGAGSAGNKLNALIQKKRAANKDLGYAAAFSEVQLEHPDLAREYAENLS